MVSFASRSRRVLSANIAIVVVITIARIASATRVSASEKPRLRGTSSILRAVILSRRRRWSAKRGTPEDGRRTPSLITRKGRRHLNVASTRGVLRPSYGAPPSAPTPSAAQDDSAARLHHP